jgi:hypothetical protein
MYWMTGILGFVLMIAPFMFGYSFNAVALWASVLIGFATIAFSGMEGLQHDRETWEYCSVVVLGAIAVLSPFILGFASLSAALWTSIVMGVLIALFAGTKLSMTVRHNKVLF